MKLTVVGCGDAFGSGGRLQTCYHVEAARTRFLIDCGATALIGLARLKLTRQVGSFTETDAISGPLTGYSVDPDQFSTHVCKQRRRERRRADPSYLDDAQSGQRTHRGYLLVGRRAETHRRRQAVRGAAAGVNNAGKRFSIWMWF